MREGSARTGWIGRGGEAGRRELGVVMDGLELGKCSERRLDWTNEGEADYDIT
jgi:hypothetical protein